MDSAVQSAGWEVLRPLGSDFEELFVSHKEVGVYPSAEGVSKKLQAGGPNVVHICLIAIIFQAPRIKPT